MPTTTYRAPSGAKDARGRVIVGSAWVNGRWRAAVDRGESLPWAGFLANALKEEWKRLPPAQAKKRYGALTLDAELEDAAMRFTAEKGRQLHERRLADGRLSGLRRVLPPRVALSILDLPGGEVLAVGGWPRMTSSMRWRRAASGEWLPPAAWLEKDAPDAISNRYFLDRNFERIEMGSASKPIWAAAVLSVHPRLDEALKTRGPEAAKVKRLRNATGREREREIENEVFGIEIPGPAWHAPLSREWTDFNHFLSRSDNRYQVRLGFLGLAQGDGERILADAAAGTSSSDQESLDRRSVSAWRKYPRFPEEIRFSPSRPGAMAGLEKTALARSLFEMFSVGVAERERELGNHRRSFWSLNEEDDAAAATAPDGSARRGSGISGRFLGISPETVRLALDRVTGPRDYVSRLVGGSDNRWSNVDFAAAFATSVTGHPIVPHIVPGEVTPGSWRKHFPVMAARLRPGLAGVVARGGTAFERLQAARALPFIASLPGVKAYAKTGTITLDKGRTETSRLCLALVKWKDEAKGEVQAGVVLSMVVEKAEMGLASAWLGEFLVREGEALRRRVR